MSFINDNNIIHCDVKPENILFNSKKINDKTNIVICDFGLSKEIKSLKKLKFSNEIQTIWYRSPEISLKMDFDYKIDIWSLGCIFYEMIFNKVLFISSDNIIHITNIYNLLGYPKNSEILSNKNYKEIIKNKPESKDLYDKYLIELLKDKYQDINKIIKVTNLITNILNWDSNERPTYEKLKTLI